MTSSASESKASFADLRHAVAEQAALRVVDVHRGQVGERSTPAVLMLDQSRATGSGRDERMAAQQRLQLSLLVGRDDVVAGMQPPALPAALVEIEHATG